MENQIDRIRELMKERNESNMGPRWGYDSETKTFKPIGGSKPIDDSKPTGGSGPGIRATKGDVTFGC